MPKVIGKDNYDRENVNDFLLRRGLTQEEAERLAADRNAAGGEHALTYYKAVPDDHRLHYFNPNGDEPYPEEVERDPAPVEDDSVRGVPMRGSNATDSQVAQFADGSCHELAVALHRMFGWSLHVVLDQDERYWEDPADADNFIPAVIHVYAVDGEEQAWDIAGVRPLASVPSELDSWTNIRSYDSDRVYDEDGLSTYVGCWGGDDPESDPIDRPLCSYTEKDIEEATQAAIAALGHLPAFQVAMAARQATAEAESPSP